MGEKQAELRRFRRDVEYYEAHREELLDRYPEQWVAIFDQRVVVADADYERVLDGLEEQGIPVGKAFIERATTKDELLILWL